MTGIPAPSRRLLPARRLGTPPPSGPNATITARSDLSPTMAVFAILPDDGVPAFAPGQYFALGLERDGRLVQRPYSAASSAGDPTLEFAIRLVPDGALTPELWRLRAGDRVRIGPPRGLFRLGTDDPRHHLLLATGTGIAPLVAMLRALASRDDPPRVVVAQGAAQRDELAFGARLEWLAATTPGAAYVPAISRPSMPANAGWAGRVGRLDGIVPALVEELRLEPARTVAYLCGNPAMIGAVSGVLQDLGLPPSAIRSEPY